MADIAEARARVLEAFKEMGAYQRQFFDDWNPGHVYETEPGSGRVVWDLDLSDVLLLAQAEPPVVHAPFSESPAAQVELPEDDDGDVPRCAECHLPVRWYDDDEIWRH